MSAHEGFSVHDRQAHSALGQGGSGHRPVLPGLPARNHVRRWLTSCLKAYLRVALTSASWLGGAHPRNRHER